MLKVVTRSYSQMIFSIIPSSNSCHAIFHIGKKRNIITTNTIVEEITILFIKIILFFNIDFCTRNLLLWIK